MTEDFYLFPLINESALNFNRLRGLLGTLCIVSGSFYYWDLPGIKVVSVCVVQDVLAKMQGK